MRSIGDNYIRARSLVRCAPIIRRQLRTMWLSYKHWRDFSCWRNGLPLPQAEAAENPLSNYFAAHRQGRGIWKVEHYFSAYHRHFQKFRGRPVHVLEIGVYSGGSLEMWRDYFGPASRIYGVDIEPSCKAYESEGVRIFVGDQSSRKFWSDVKTQVPDLDIVIDDGSHVPMHQIISLEEMLPHLRPGGVYMCEDVCQTFSEFVAYLFGLEQNLNASGAFQNNDEPDRRLVFSTNQVQAVIESIHHYPFLIVIERNLCKIAELIAPKHGTEWEPFLK